MLSVYYGHLLTFEGYHACQLVHTIKYSCGWWEYQKCWTQSKTKVLDKLKFQPAVGTRVRVRGSSLNVCVKFMAIHPVIVEGL